MKHITLTTAAMLAVFVSTPLAPLNAQHRGGRGRTCDMHKKHTIK